MLLFLEVFSKEDKEKLIQQGYKFIKQVQLSSTIKYVFANNPKLTFNKNEVKARVTNALTF